MDNFIGGKLVRVGKKVTVIDSVRGYFNGKEGIVRVVNGDKIGVKLVGVRYSIHPELSLTWFKINQLK